MKACFESDLSEDDFIFSGDSVTLTTLTTLMTLMTAMAMAMDDGDGDGDTGTPVTGDPDDDQLHGSSSNENQDGGGGNDTLYGGRGDDRLKGGPGVDSYEGGPGNDVIEVDYFDFTDGMEPPEDSDREMAQGVFDGGENDDGTADSDTLSFADFTDADGNNRGVRVRLTEGDVIYKSDIADDRQRCHGLFHQHRESHR